jgi:hypothetical protein
MHLKLPIVGVFPCLNAAMVEVNELSYDTSPMAVKAIRAMKANGERIAEIARHFLMGETSIRLIIQGKTWKWVT